MRAVPCPGCDHPHQFDDDTHGTFDCPCGTSYRVYAVPADDEPEAPVSKPLPAGLIAAAAVCVPVLLGLVLLAVRLSPHPAETAVTKPDPPAVAVRKPLPPLPAKPGRPNRPDRVVPKTSVAPQEATPEVKPEPVALPPDDPDEPDPLTRQPETPAVVGTTKKATPASTAARPKKEHVPGYYYRKMSGFPVLVSKEAYDASDAAKGGPLAYLEYEFKEMAGLFPAGVLKKLQTVPTWVEWDLTEPGHPNAVAIYRGGSAEGAWRQGVDPRKAKCVTVLSLKRLHEHHANDETRRMLVILHEMAHAVHLEAFGHENVAIKATYRQAMERRLYDDVEDEFGNKGPAYAKTNESEYLAEVSCAYLDRCQYFPFDRDDLKEHDPKGYDLMVKVWGKPDRIKARK